MNVFTKSVSLNRQIVSIEVRSPNITNINITLLYHYNNAAILYLDQEELVIIMQGNQSSVIII